MLGWAQVLGLPFSLGVLELQEHFSILNKLMRQGQKAGEQGRLVLLPSSACLPFRQGRPRSGLALRLDSGCRSQAGGTVVGVVRLQDLSASFLRPEATKKGV